MVRCASTGGDVCGGTGIILYYLHLTEIENSMREEGTCHTFSAACRAKEVTHIMIHQLSLAERQSYSIQNRLAGFLPEMTHQET